MWLTSIDVRHMTASGYVCDLLIIFLHFTSNTPFYFSRVLILYSLSHCSIGSLLQAFFIRRTPFHLKEVPLSPTTIEVALLKFGCWFKEQDYQDQLKCLDEYDRWWICVTIPLWSPHYTICHFFYINCHRSFVTLLRFYLLLITPMEPVHLFIFLIACLPVHRYKRTAVNT